MGSTAEGAGHHLFSAPLRVVPIAGTHPADSSPHWQANHPSRRPTDTANRWLATNILWRTATL